MTYLSPGEGGDEDCKNEVMVIAFGEAAAAVDVFGKAVGALGEPAA
jgi:hypothetical protein